MKKQHIAYLAVGSMLALAIAVMTSLFQSNNTPEQSVFRVGYLPISASIAVFVAEQEGLFAQEGVSVELVPYTSGLVMADDVVAQKIDATAVGPGDVFLSREIDDPGTYAIYLHTQYSSEEPLYSLVVPTDSPVRSTADLQGKKIAVFPGVTNVMLLELVLRERHGWENETDYAIVTVPPAQQLDGLRTHTYDALMPLEPLGTVADSMDDLHVIEWGLVEGTVLSPLPITTQVLSSTAVNEKPDATAGFVRAMEQAAGLVNEDRSRYANLLVTKIHLTEEQARMVHVGEYVTAGDETAQASFQQLTNILHEEGVLSEHVSVVPLYYYERD